MKTKKSSSGFTLIEMAISLVIVGVLIGAIALPYSVWLKKNKYETTVENVERMAFSVGAFRSANGRYPCPASLDLPRTDPEYGQPGNCSDTTSIPSNSCQGGVCVANSRRILVNIDINSNNTIDTNELNFRPRVRIGAIPFRALNISEDFTIDAYGNKILYAVTESQAANHPYNPEGGGISIEYNDENNLRQSRLPIPDSGHFIVLSHGSNKAGGYTRYGASSDIACDTTIPDGENCDHIAGIPNSTFYVGDFSTASSGMNDDIALYKMPLNAPLWARSPDNPDSIYAILSSSAGGKVGGDYQYNFLTAADPDALGEDTRLFIRGNMLIEDQDGIGGDTLAIEFCNREGVDCFPADMIGGEGVSCRTGKMYGVNEATAACIQNNINIDCPDGKILKSMYNGALICDFRPCRPIAKTICSQTISLPGALHGSTENIYTGDNECYGSTYACNNGQWLELSASGQCSCTAGTTTANTGCASPMIGDGITTSVTQTCEFRNCYATTDTVTDCRCPEGTSTPPFCFCNNGAVDTPTCLSCPSGYTGSPPNCTPPPCPDGTSGVYPSCTCDNGARNAPECTLCPIGHSGSPPNCEAPSCPAGTVGTYPNCLCPNGASNPPNCSICPSGYSGNPPNCVAPNCSAGTSGIYPNCTCDNGNPNTADCDACPNNGAGIYPSCISCPSGTSGIPPNCLCDNGANNPPSCTLATCPAGTSGTPPNCTCNNGYTNPPSCTCEASETQCCNEFNNPPICGPPACDPDTECCYDGAPGCGGVTLPPCQGGTQPPACYVP